MIAQLIAEVLSHVRVIDCGSPAWTAPHLHALLLSMSFLIPPHISLPYLLSVPSVPVQPVLDQVIATFYISLRCMPLRFFPFCSFLSPSPAHCHLRSTSSLILSNHPKVALESQRFTSQLSKPAEYSISLPSPPSPPSFLPLTPRLPMASPHWKIDLSA